MLLTCPATGTTGAVYGVINNGASSGTIYLVAPGAAVDLYYNCEYHGLMSSTLSVVLSK